MTVKEIRNEGPVHVYPVGIVDDWYHDKEGYTVDMPLDDCCLCQLGICTQKLMVEGFVLHSIDKKKEQ